MTDDEVLQLAMYTAALDAKRFGAEFQPGVFRPTWEDRGPAGQEAYLTDARTQFEAMETIQRIRRPDWTALPADAIQRARNGENILDVFFSGQSATDGETEEKAWEGFSGESAEEHAHVLAPYRNGGTTETGDNR